jgi:2-amino-4-hydroxy-6-hydroxymethyldihydropteridine diphosphokinase
VRASLADQDDGQLSCLAAAVAQALQRPDTLAIALGANLPSPAGEPADTLLAVRPLLEQMLQRWAQASLLFRWSPLLQTAPVGGPPGQRPYSNGVLLVELPVALAVKAAGSESAVALDAARCDASECNATRPQGLVSAAPTTAALARGALTSAAVELLQCLQQLEAQFGRPPQPERQHWGPRSLDLDLLWWGQLELDLPATAATPALQLPHPLWRQRSFVLEPLATLIEAGCADAPAVSQLSLSPRNTRDGSIGTA